MDLLSIFKGGRYFDKSIAPKCDYCQYGKRARDGNKVLCEKRGLVDREYSCTKFVYSPLKRIPVKQLRFVGSLADEDIYIESLGERAEKEAAQKAEEKAEMKAREEAKKAQEAARKAAEEARKAAEEAAKQAEMAENAPEEPKAEDALAALANDALQSLAETPAEQPAAPAYAGQYEAAAPEQRYVGRHEAPGPEIPAAPTEAERNYVGLHEASPYDNQE